MRKVPFTQENIERFKAHYSDDTARRKYGYIVDMAICKSDFDIYMDYLQKTEKLGLKFILIYSHTENEEEADTLAGFTDFAVAELNESNAFVSGTREFVDEETFELIFEGWLKGAECFYVSQQTPLQKAMDSIFQIEDKFALK